MNTERPIAVIPLDLARAAVAQVMSYPFKVWGFGEDIALRAMLEFTEVTGEDRAAEFARQLVNPWCGAASILEPADHVAPGLAIIGLYERTGDKVYLSSANSLGALYRSFDKVDGVFVHRPDLEGLSSLVWVDCMALDGPFLARLARLHSDEAWLELAVQTVRAYTDVLTDDRSGLFRHGYDVRRKCQSECNWGRGNGWAMHGLVDTLELLPRHHPAVAEFRTVLNRQVEAVLELQDEGGLWHTILDDSESPLEISTAALFASALLKADRLRLLDAPFEGSGGNRSAAATVGRAMAALLSLVGNDGGLSVSCATPVGSRETYCNAPTGVFPWGQGPLILAFTEGVRTLGKDSLSKLAKPGSHLPTAASGGESA